MQTKHCWHEECQDIQACNTPMPATPTNAPEIAAALDDDSTVDSSPHDVMS